MDLLFFAIFAFIAVVCAINVVVQRHPISSALSLVGVMASLAVLYLLLGGEFIAMAQIIVYAGAVMVLFVFVIMLLNSDVPSFDLGRTHLWLKILGAGASLALFALFIRAFQTSGAPAISGPATPNAIEAAGGNTKVLSQMMFSEYILPFELTSVLLLGAIVGAVAIAKRKPPAGAQSATYGAGTHARRSPS